MGRLGILIVLSSFLSLMFEIKVCVDGGNQWYGWHCLKEVPFLGKKPPLTFSERWNNIH